MLEAFSFGNIKFVSGNDQNHCIYVLIITKNEIQCFENFHPEIKIKLP